MSSNRRIHLQSGFVLHSKSYRNTSMLVDIFTPQYGRVSLVAKGVRRLKSPSFGLLQVFRPLSFSWSGRSDLMTLTAVEADGPVANLHGKLLFSGFYLNELLMRLLHRFDAHESLYYRYQAAINGLQYLQEIEDLPQRHLEHERQLRGFEKVLLQEIGYGLILDHNVETGEPISGENRYHYVLEQGPVSAYAAAREGVELSGRSLLALHGDDLKDVTTLKECKRLMRAVLAHHLGDKPLHTRNLINELEMFNSQGVD